ncbi:MAG: flagellar basal body L-ring protein FlgH [Tepidisphaeraceae bacterium]|jgi:flagellar L-ring protein precursor FlgH
MSVQSNNHNFIAIASAAVFAAAGTALAQNIPSQSNPSAYTTSPQAAGVEPVSSPPVQLPIGLITQRTGGSLLRAESFGKSDGGPITTAAASYYDVPEPKPKLLRKHDLVTIVIRENSQFASNDTTDLKHSNDLDALIDSYMTFGLKNGPALNEHLPTTPIEMKTSGQRDFKGTAALERDDTFTGRITAEVIDVKPNGTLILQATEEIKTDEEEQRVTLIGTCRVDDITPDNTVLSNQIYNLSLDKQHKGAVKDTGTRGLFTRLLDWINPF